MKIIIIFAHKSLIESMTIQYALAGSIFHHILS